MLKKLNYWADKYYGTEFFNYVWFNLDICHAYVLINDFYMIL